MSYHDNTALEGNLHIMKFHIACKFVLSLLGKKQSIQMDFNLIVPGCDILLEFYYGCFITNMTTNLFDIEKAENEAIPQIKYCSRFDQFLLNSVQVILVLITRD